MNDFFVIGNEVLQWFAIGLLLWGCNKMADATSQLQKLAGRSLNKEINENMKRIHETETFQ